MQFCGRARNIFIRVARVSVVKLACLPIFVAVVQPKALCVGECINARSVLFCRYCYISTQITRTNTIPNISISLLTGQTHVAIEKLHHQIIKLNDNLKWPSKIEIRSIVFSTQNQKSI